MSMSSLEKTRSSKTSHTTRSDIVFEQSNEERNGAMSCNQIPVTVEQSQKGNTIFEGGFLLSATSASGIYYTIDRKAPKKP